TFHSFRAQFAFVEREFVPGFISNYLIVFYQELDSALLAAKTAVCIYYFVRHNTGIQSPASRPRKMRAKLFSNRFRLCAKCGHGSPFKYSLWMEIVAVFDVERALAESRIDRCRHGRREHGTFGRRSTWKPQLALG